MFGTIARSWEFAKISYSLIWDHKKLTFFPAVSSIAAVLVTLSFLLPLWQTGQLSEWFQFMDEETTSQGGSAAMYITAFLFYFCNYFVIVFFNTGLTACTLKIINGEEAGISYGIGFAVKRLPQILGWALVSAFVGVLLKALERSHKKAGAIIAAVLGSAWTALTYFIVPVIVVEGVGPVEAFKESVSTLRSTWGTALVGNFSLGLFAFIIMLPLFLVMGALLYLAGVNGSVPGTFAVAVMSGVMIFFAAAATSAADSVFKVLLYAYATGKTVPANYVNRDTFSEAFKTKD